jgi:hypothetical protein
VDAAKHCALEPVFAHLDAAELTCLRKLER